MSFIIVAGTLVWGNVIFNYGLNTSTNSSEANFSKIYDIINDTYDLSQDVKNSTLYSDIESGTTAADSMLLGSYKAIKTSIVLLPSLIYNILTAIASQLHLPGFVLVFAITGLFIMIIFSLIYLIFRYTGD